MSSKKSSPEDNGKNRSRERSQSRLRVRSRSGSRESRGRRSPSPLSSRNARIRQFQASRGFGVSVDSGSTAAAPVNFFPSKGIHPPNTSYLLGDLMKGSTSPSTLSDIDSGKPIRLGGPATAGLAFASSPAFVSYGAFAGPASAGHACAGGGGGTACWSPDLTLKRDKRPAGISIAAADAVGQSNPRAANMQQSFMESVYADPFSGPNPVVVRDINLGDNKDYDEAQASRISAPNLYNLPKTPGGGRKRTKKYTKRKRQTRRKTFRKRK